MDYTVLYNIVFQGCDGFEPLSETQKQCIAGSLGALLTAIDSLGLNEIINRIEENKK
jgi:hypothetical protein